jgi:hypothetical protein
MLWPDPGGEVSHTAELGIEKGPVIARQWLVTCRSAAGGFLLHAW